MGYQPSAGLLDWPTFFDKVRSTEFEVVEQRRKKINLLYYNTPAGFDIETSSFYVGGTKQAIMYEWTFGIHNMITYGRSWRELKEFMQLLALNLDLGYKRLIVYVHNLPYEWQFMRKYFMWDDVFLMEERSPLYAVTEGFEFRDSLKLTNKSLENSAKDLQKYKCQKLVGDLEYSLIRTPETPLTAKELGYCENDVRILLHLIQEKIEQEEESGGNVATIPYTLTGYVRREVRGNMFRNRSEEFEDWDVESASHEEDVYDYGRV